MGGTKTIILVKIHKIHEHYMYFVSWNCQINSASQLFGLSSIQIQTVTISTELFQFIIIAITVSVTLLWKAFPTSMGMLEQKVRKTMAMLEWTLPHAMSINQFVSIVFRTTLFNTDFGSVLIIFNEFATHLHGNYVHLEPVGYSRCYFIEISSLYNFRGIYIHIIMNSCGGFTVNIIHPELYCVVLIFIHFI